MPKYAITDDWWLIPKTGEPAVSNDSNKETPGEEHPADTGSQGDPARDQPTKGSAQSGPTFTEGPDPLAGIKKGMGDLMDSMEGKTVSMKTYVGTIIGVIVLMMLARCGG